MMSVMQPQNQTKEYVRIHNDRLLFRQFVESSASIVLEALERSVKLSGESVITKNINSHCGCAHFETS